MASLTRVRLGYFPHKYIHLLNQQSIKFRIKQKVLFHCSPYLDVKGQPIKMPSLSPTMSEGTIVKWLKKEGDSIAPGDALCDIQTDKAVISMETDDEGILAKIIVPENTKDVKVGALIALMVAEGEDWKTVELPDEEVEAAGAPAASPVATAEASSSEASAPVITGPPTIEIKMPSLSPTMSEGTIVKWLKKEGDAIQPGDALCDIQTDKAVMSMETEEEGILAKILVPDDTKDVKIGTLIALIVAEGEDWKSVVVSKPASAPAKPRSAPAPSPTHAPAKTAKPAGSSTHYGPAVRSLLDIYHLDGATITHTGRRKTLLKSDVLKHIADNRLQKQPPKPVPLPSKAGSAPAKASPAPQTPKPGQKYVDVELSNMRKVIAKRLTQSKYEIPHAYGEIQCNIDQVLTARKGLQKDGIKVSVNDFVIKAVAVALERVPDVNAVYANGVKRLNTVDICIAVATDAGLITPIVKDANRKGVVEISEAVKALAGKARAGKLKPEEFTGGGFTISNLGMFGITHFSAIINPPQIAILAVGGGIPRLAPDLSSHTDMIVTLSFDGRAIDDFKAAEFLQVFREYIEDPSRMIIGAPGIRKEGRL